MTNIFYVLFFCTISAITAQVPVTTGSKATLTIFNDAVLQCGKPKQGEKVVAINPLLLGYSIEDWKSEFSSASPADIPWCNKFIEVSIGGKTGVYKIMDTCQPCSGTGCGSAPKCDYDDVIDFHTADGSNGLNDLVGGDFYQGAVTWKLVDSGASHVVPAVGSFQPSAAPSVSSVIIVDDNSGGSSGRSASNRDETSDAKSGKKRIPYKKLFQLLAEAVSMDGDDH